MKKLHAIRGMTLIEAIVWIFMFIAAMLAIVSSLLYFYRTSNYAVEEASAVAAGQRGIDLLVRTLREASYSSNGAYPIISIGPNQIIFYSDVNSNSAIEEVSYYVSTTSLLEDVVEPVGNPPAYTGATSTSDISDYVHNIDQNITTFTYFDKNGNQITDYTKVGDVRFVTINLVVDVNQNDKPGQLTLRSSAALRNIDTH